jgi:hypothetical protein
MILIYTFIPFEKPPKSPGGRLYMYNFQVLCPPSGVWGAVFLNDQIYK